MQAANSGGHPLRSGEFFDMVKGEIVEVSLEQRDSDAPKSVTRAERITAICKSILETPCKIEQISRQYFKQHELKNTWNELRQNLYVIDLKDLTEEEKKKLEPTLVKVYKVLNQLVEKSSDPAVKQDITQRMSILRGQCEGLGPQLCELDAFSRLGDQFLIDQMDDFLLDVAKNGKDLCLIRSKSANNSQQHKVFEVMKNFVTNLDKPEITKHFSFLQLFEMKMNINILMINYTIHQKRNLDNCEHIFKYLKQANSILINLMANIGPERYGPIPDQCGQRMLKLIDVLEHENKVYFPEFWSDPTHIQELKKGIDFMSICCKFVRYPDEVTIDDLTFVKKNDESGLSLYVQLSAESQSDALVVFCHGKEGPFPYWNWNQSRSSDLEIGGLGHSPVINKAQENFKVMKELFKSKELKELIEKFPKSREFKLITAGYGIDGAIAQLLAFQWALDNPEMQTRTYMLGVAPYLDTNAAGQFKFLKNHYGINFVLSEDKNVNQNKLSSSTQNKYSNDNFHALYPLYNRDWFLTDWMRHDRQTCVSKVKEQMVHLQDMHALYSEVKQLNILKQNFSEQMLFEKLKQHFNKEKK